MRLFIVDSAHTMRRVMASILDDEPDISVVGSSADEAGAVPHLADCDIVLVSANLPDNGALKLAETAAQKSPSTKVVLMDWADSQEALRRFVRAGIADYLMENESLDELIEKMRLLTQESDP